MQQTPERIQHLWSRLVTIGGFTYESRPGPRSLTGWQGEGHGRVQVDKAIAGELHFIEQGHFQLSGGQNIEMHNRFIWRKTTAGIVLSHGRRGEPVFLFELIPTADGLWKSAQDHVCINDLYSGELRESANGFELTWHIDGPKKDEHLFYRYFPDNS